MRVIRLALPPDFSTPPLESDFLLPPDQARHGALVLRLKSGHEIELVGPLGLARALIVRIDSGEPLIAVRLISPWGQAENNGPRLALALIQNQRFEWAIEKAVELGASSLTPLVSQRTKADRAGQTKQNRWQRLADEARKQCGRSAPMQIRPPVNFKDFLTEEVGQTGPKIFLNPQGRALPPALASEPRPLILIGPEGGFAQEEEEAMLELDFFPWTLGSTILRAETAALAALAGIQLNQTNL